MIGIDDEFAKDTRDEAHGESDETDDRAIPGEVSAAPSAPALPPPPPPPEPFFRDPACDEQKRHRSMCACRGEARKPIA